MTIYALDHVQIAMPPGRRGGARLYSGVLGLTEQPKPPNLAQRGVWFTAGRLKLHLGVEPAFRPRARRIRAARAGLDALIARCKEAGFPPVTDEPLAGYSRVYVYDPFGNRLELMEEL
ncbi:MAG: hypothetical protein R2911_34420 [Caldilineaceae bacterium]